MLDHIDQQRLLDLAQAARVLPRHTEARLLAEVAFEDAMLPFMTSEQRESWSNFCFNAFDGDQCIDKALSVLGLPLQLP